MASITCQALDAGGEQRIIAPAASAPTDGSYDAEVGTDG